MLDGDAVQLSIEVGRAANVVLCQASATQLHGGNGRGITFEASVNVAADARFAYLPFELIPFANSSYRQSLHLSLEHGAQAILTEVVTPGRSWERFCYARMDLRTEVRLDGRRILFDAQRIVPRETDPSLLLAGFTHFATLLHLGADAGVAEADALHGRFKELGVCGGASALPEYGVGARVVGDSADQLLQALSTARCEQPGAPARCLVR